MPIIHPWLSLLAPLGASLGAACGVASGLYYRRRQIGDVERRIILIIGLGSMLLFYSIAYEGPLGTHLGAGTVIGAMILSGSIVLLGAIMWLRSGGHKA